MPWHYKLVKSIDPDTYTPCDSVDDNGISYGKIFVGSWGMRRVTVNGIGYSGVKESFGVPVTDKGELLLDCTSALLPPNIQKADDHFMTLLRSATSNPPTEARAYMNRIRNDPALGGPVSEWETASQTFERLRTYPGLLREFMSDLMRTRNDYNEDAATVYSNRKHKF